MRSLSRRETKPRMTRWPASSRLRRRSVSCIDLDRSRTIIEIDPLDGALLLAVGLRPGQGHGDEAQRDDAADRRQGAQARGPARAGQAEVVHAREEERGRAPPAQVELHPCHQRTREQQQQRPGMAPLQLLADALLVQVAPHDQRGDAADDEEQRPGDRHLLAPPPGAARRQVLLPGIARSHAPPWAATGASAGSAGDSAPARVLSMKMRASYSAWRASSALAS